MRMNSWLLYTITLVCAVVLDLLVMRLSRRYFSVIELEKEGLRPVIFRGQNYALLTMLLRGPKFLWRKITRALLPFLLKVRSSARARIASFLIAFSGLILVGVGQLQRENWFQRENSSLVLLGCGLLLLTLGITALERVFGRPITILAQPENVSVQTGRSSDSGPLSWVSPGWALLIAGGLLVVFGTQLNNPRWMASGWLGFGALQIAGGVWSLFVGFPARLTRLTRRVELTPDRVIFLICGLMLSIATTALAGMLPKMIHPTAAVLAWLCGILFAVLGAWRPAVRGRFTIGQLPWQPIAIGVGLALLSLPLRAIQTDVLPLGLTGDEGSMGANAVRFLTGEVNNIFNTGWFAFPSLFFFIQSGFIAVFGQTAEALRFSAVFAGALGIAVTYWVALAMFGQRVALLTGFFLIFFHFHVHFSRIGLNNIWDALFFTWVLGAFWVGWTHRSRGAFTLAGLGLGLSLYFYASARVLFLLVPLLGLLFCWLGRRRILPYLPHFILLFWVAVTVALPLGWFFVRLPGEFMAPLDRVRISEDWLRNEERITGMNERQIMQNQFLLSLQGFTDLPTRPLYAPGTPILLTFPAILFWIGAAVFLSRWRDTRFWMLAGWLGSVVSAVALSVNTPSGHRYIASAPALAIVVGLGLSGLMAMLEQFSAKKWAGMLLAACLLPVVGVIETRTYISYASSPVFGGGHNMVAQALAEILMQEPDMHHVYFFEDSGMGYPYPQLMYLSPTVNGLDVKQQDDWQDDRPASLMVSPADQPCLFVILAERKNQLSILQAKYPGGKVSTAYAPDLSLLFWLYDPNPPFSQPAIIKMKTFQWGGSRERRYSP